MDELSRHRESLQKHFNILVEALHEGVPAISSGMMEHPDPDDPAYADRHEVMSLLCDIVRELEECDKSAPIRNILDPCTIEIMEEWLTHCPSEQAETFPDHDGWIARSVSLEVESPAQDIIRAAHMLLETIARFDRGEFGLAVKAATKLGSLLERYRLRRDFELDVLKRTHQQNGLVSGRQTRTEVKQSKAARAIAEIKRRKTGGKLSATQIIEQMAKEIDPKDPNRKRKLWGSRPTLMRYCKYQGMNLNDQKVVSLGPNDTTFRINTSITRTE